MDADAPDCTCDECAGICSYKPGWFRPGEAEATAAGLGVSLAELFRTSLAVDWHGDVDGETVFVLAPALRSSPAGREYPGDPRGECVFFAAGRCGIHRAKPFECRAAHHGDSFAVARARHLELARAWRPHQATIEALLGRAPTAAPYSPDSTFPG